jgi:Biopolymer transport protein
MELKPPKDEEVDFELTPMIDVVFLLIAFFMTVTTFSSAEMVKMQMPVAPSSKVPEDISGRQFISIDHDGTLFLGSRKTDVEEIQARVAALQSTPDFRGVYLRADSRTPYRYVSKVMNACAEVGVSNIIFGVEQQKN